MNREYIVRGVYRIVSVLSLVSSTLGGLIDNVIVG